MYHQRLAGKLPANGRHGGRRLQANAKCHNDWADGGVWRANPAFPLHHDQLRQDAAAWQGFRRYPPKYARNPERNITCTGARRLLREVLQVEKKGPSVLKHRAGVVLGE